MNQQKAILYKALPLASLTAIGMLATDLYLPAIPLLPNALGGTVAQAQLTLASFMGALATSQILWGWASDRFGERQILNLGIFLLLIGSVLGAMTSSIEVLILARALQGLGAGAATAVVPALLKKTFSEADAVRSISLVGMAESLVPALAPILGAFIVTALGWRSTFWIIAGLTLIVFPMVARVTKDLASPVIVSKNMLAALKELFQNRDFLKGSFSYATMFSALIIFVASAPQLIAHTYHLSIQYFSAMQVVGVATFILGASQSGSLVEKLGTKKVLYYGAGFQGLAAVSFLLLSFFGGENFYLLTATWGVSGLGLGLRGPVLFSTTLSYAPTQAGQASGLLMFFAFGLSSLVTAAVAPFLDFGLLPLALGISVLTVISVYLSTRLK